MAIDTEKSKDLEYMVQDSNFASEKKMLNYKAIPHIYTELRKQAKRQIQYYVNQILYHPERKSVYIKYINEIIIDEQSHGRGIKSRCFK